METLRPGRNGRYDVQVNWSSAAGADYFAVLLDRYATNVSAGAGNAVRFDDVPLDEFYYVSVQAFSRAGHSAETVWYTARSRPGPDGDGDGDAAADAADADGYPWTVAVPLVLMASCAAAAVAEACGWRCGRLRPAADTDATATAAAVMAQSGHGHYYDMVTALGAGDALLDRDRVIVSDELLGRGHFGVVRKGAVRTDRGDRPVAVKSLREHATSRELQQFVGEILLMQKVGEHPNVVAMVGCCLDAAARCLLVVEYCALGDLQTYLRRVSAVFTYNHD